MKQGKFSGSHKKEVKAKALQEKLEILALGLAEQAITGTKTLHGIVDLEEGLAVLKTLSTHFATVNRVDTPEPEGNAFDEYKKRIKDGGGGGDSGRSLGPNVVKLEFSDLFTDSSTATSPVSSGIPSESAEEE